jgi:hypothetical protein
MIRKQVYIQYQQQAILARLARALGVSEAEVIRRAIDYQGSGALRRASHPDLTAWAEAYAFMLDLHARGPLPASGERRSWTRDDLHEERPRRHAADLD